MAMEPSAKIIEDSISPCGVRITTIQAVMHRFVLAEFNTHRLFSRNSASSRAIPVEKQLARLLENPAWPVEWASEQPGMQGGTELQGEALLDAQRLFHDVFEEVTVAVERYLEAHPDKSDRLHKSLINRLMEPFMYHTVVVTATDWDNFWHQRVSEFSPLAQPEMRACADAMYEAFGQSTPKEVDYGEWHLPYITHQDWDWAEAEADDDLGVKGILRQISTARCARVSYLTQEGTRDPHEDLVLHDRLVTAKPMHASPLEHPATPATPGEIYASAVQGNFYGWHQYRHSIKPHVPDAAVAPPALEVAGV